ncbi:hypothetical protein KL86PLE_10162 [uncultured Pleomorphomonas sp.]|uniref:Uncharacterized protein n=2 Tax=Pleomorphomonas TaxID=261933 RepID=A0A2G9WSS9_9HYPH|nr:hypothetical protein [Pleomorphomonas carboxyditropha]PIO97769.1 hypothetical protein CJ014_19010 [Pleomorphomonas carboxyditropha]SCM70454.1 hypothetical protein KL86PLE_10162 [uncultured Pleomorphomonas sp.]
MNAPHLPPESWPAQDVEDLLVLVRFVSEEKRRKARGEEPASSRPDALACRRLTERCALVPRPRAPGGYTASLVGMSRLYRFIHAPVGVAPEMPVDREVEVRRTVLEALNPPDRGEVEARMCAELVEMRAGIFRCAHADLCAGRGCPFELEVSADAVDRALCALLPKGN